MKSFRVKQAIGDKTFYYIQVYYFGIPWSTVNHTPISWHTMPFSSPKLAIDYIRKMYGDTANIKTTW